MSKVSKGERKFLFKKKIIIRIISLSLLEIFDADYRISVFQLEFKKRGIDIEEEGKN